MNWKKFLGDELFEKTENYLSGKKLTVAAFMRMLVERFFERG